MCDFQSQINRSLSRLVVMLLMAAGASCPLFAHLGSITRQEGITNMTGNGVVTTINRDTNISNGMTDTGFLEVTSFSVQDYETLIINQERPDSTLVIRVTGGSGTLIMGKIQATGRVILIDESGVDTTIGSEITANLFVASTIEFNDTILSAYPATAHVSLGSAATSGVRIDGTIHTTSDSYYNGTSTVNVESGIFLLGQRVSVSGLVRTSSDGNVVVLAGNRVQTFFGNNPEDHSEIVLPITAGHYQGAIDIHGEIGLYNPPPNHVIIMADVTEAVADQYDLTGQPVIDISGEIHSYRGLQIDGGSWGRTRLDGGASLDTGGYGIAGQIDILGGHVQVFDAWVRSVGDLPNTIRVGGDEADLGSNRKGDSGTRMAFATHIGVDADLDTQAGDTLKVTGYAVLTEGELPILLVAGHDGTFSPPWMLNRSTVYGNPNIVCDDGGSISLGEDNDTRELANNMADRMLAATGKRASVLDFRVARTNVDVNRRPGRATGNCISDENDDSQMYGYGSNPENNLAYDSFDMLMGVAQAQIDSGWGAGLMLDIHGNDEGGDYGPLNIGYRIAGRDDDVTDPGLWDVLADATNKTEAQLSSADFTNTTFKNYLNRESASATWDTESMVKDSSCRNLIETSNETGDDWATWNVLFGPDSIWRQMDAKTDGLGNAYRLYMVEDVDFTTKFRRGGYLMRRHGSNDRSQDADLDPFDDSKGPHAGFVESVDGIQLEVPKQYRFLISSYDNSALIPDFANDLADAIAHFVENTYGFTF